MSAKWRRCLGGCGTLIAKGSYCRACHPYNSRQWRGTSAQVIFRDRHQCQIKGPHCTGLATTTDHIYPVAAGGTSDLSNLRAACRNCNSERAASTQGGRV